MRAIFRMCRFVCFTGSISWKWKSATPTTSRKVGYALGCRLRARSVQTILLQRCPLRKIWEIKSYNEYDHIAFYAFQYIPIIFSGSPSECWLHTCRACVAVTSYQVKHEEPQEVIFLHGIWRHMREFGIEGQIPRISSPVKLEKRC